ncbi:helix-turn-helix domain-containing protein [Mycolicibacterium fortuitum]|nr:helix-turn-helix domain-containing protein [Mycolicibacterium fortuitum]
MFTDEVSEMINTSPATLRYWRHADTGPASFLLGKRVVYRRSEVERWIAEQEQATRRGGSALINAVVSDVSTRTDKQKKAAVAPGVVGLAPARD